jgi:hypothetical protein
MNIITALALVNEERQLNRQLDSIKRDNRWSTEISERDQSIMDELSARINEIQKLINN